MTKMRANHRGTEPLWQSSTSRRTGPTLGQDVPSGREIFARALAGWMLLALGWLVLANTAIASAGPEVTGSDWSFALLAALTATVTARGVWLGARWAWWLAAAYGAAGLFFVLPVTAAVLFGPSRDPVGTGWDIVLFPLITGVTFALLAALWMSPPGKATT
jgi:hypothetical protein